MVSRPFRWPTGRLAAAHGYTLIEVLVAFVILAMVLTVLLRIFSAGTRNIEIADTYTRAVLVGEALLAAAADPGAPPVAGDFGGLAADRFAWRRVVTPLPPVRGDSVPQETPRAHRVSVRVAWSAPGGRRQIELATVRVDPPEGSEVRRTSWR